MIFQSLYFIWSLMCATTSSSVGCMLCAWRSTPVWQHCFFLNFFFEFSFTSVSISLLVFYIDLLRWHISNEFACIAHCYGTIHFSCNIPAQFHICKPHLSAAPPLVLAAAPAAYLMSLYLLQNSFLWFLQICNPTCSHSLFIYTYLAQPTTCCGCKCMYVCVCECVRVRQFNCVNPLASFTKAVAAMPDLNASEWIPQI